jgi:cytoskeletal protein RodZ
MDEIENTEATKLEAETPIQSPRQRLLSEIGQKLVLAREARGEQLSIVVRKLKLREVYLQALEAGNWDCLPDDVYALGFLRQYSNYLALDLEDEIQSIKHDQYMLTRPLTFPDPPVAPSHKWAWIAGTAFVILFVAFNIISQDKMQNLLGIPTTVSPNSELVTPTNREVSLVDNTSAEGNPEAATKPTQEAESIPISPTPKVPSETDQTTINDSLPKSGTLTGTTPVEINTEHVSAEQTSPADSVSTPSEIQSPALPDTAQPAIIDLAAKPLLPAESKETAGPAESKPAAVHHFLFEAVTASVWLQVFLPDETGKAKGKLYREVLLQKGDHSSIRKAVESLWITCGNPVALRIKVDGKVQAEPGSLGDIGKVLRNYHFKISRQSNN